MFFSNKRDLSNTLLEKWADKQYSGSYLVFINVLAKKNNTKEMRQEAKYKTHSKWKQNTRCR